MKKLNNKGFTIVEVLVCFILVSVVMMSLFSTISSFNEKRIQEAYRAKVYEYKNSLTNTIQSDFIKKGLSYARVSKEPVKMTFNEGGTSIEKVVGIKHILECVLRNGEERTLIVYEQYAKTHRRMDGLLGVDDEFYIEYGTNEEMIREDFPYLGEVAGGFKDGVFVVGETNCGTKENPKACCGTDDNPRACIVKSFQINNVDISITNEHDPAQDGHILNIYIGFYHPDLGTKYAISIVSPIDYQPNMANISTNFATTENTSETNKIYYQPIG